MLSQTQYVTWLDSTWHGTLTHAPAHTRPHPLHANNSFSRSFNYHIYININAIESDNEPFPFANFSNKIHYLLIRSTAQMCCVLCYKMINL